MAGDERGMITNCPVCGKAFDVIWPQIWVYKRGTSFICSWKCLREMEKKEDTDMYTKIKADGTPAKKSGPKPKVTAVKMPADFVPPEPNEIKIKKIEPEFEYKVTGIETGIGSFQYFRKNGYLDWTPLDDNGTVSLTVEEWRELLKQLPEVMNLLKVGDPHD